MKRPSLSPLRLFEPASAFPQLAGASATSSTGGPMFFARNSGGGSGSGTGGGGGRRPDDADPDYDDFEDGTFDFEDEAPAANARGGSRRTDAGGQGGSSGGRQRTVQFQPEERYWTEYLRIALPVIGLLLMLGLFWFWAQSLIGDGNSKEPEATTAPGLVVTATESVAIPTETVAVAPTQAPTQAVEPTQAPTQAAAPTQAESPATPPAAEIAVGGTVVTTEEVNMRPEASTAGDPIAQIPAGTTLTVIEGPQDDGTYTWWKVEDAQGDTGWVVSDYIQASGE
ncbi:MAG: SH3 domain-containing protein [Thermomicrobiales bacterium]